MSAVHGTTAGTADASGAGTTGPAEVPPADEGLDVQFARLTAAGSAWLAVKRDQVAIRAKRMALVATLGAGAAIAASSVVFVSIFLLLGGLTDLLASSLHLRSGSAGLIVGGGILLLIGLGAWLIRRRLERGWSQRLRDCYGTSGTGKRT